MRNTFAENLVKLAEKDKSIYLLVGDLGFSVFEDFIKKFPDRFFDCGVAEQNMISLAAGLSLEGKKPYVYSMVPFATMRCFEQIRNDICYPNLNVKIVGMGTGFCYGTQDFTHYGIEDVSILRVLPNMSILCPADPLEMRDLTRQSYERKGPVYIRLAKSKKLFHKSQDKILFGKPFVFKEGKDGVVITSGPYLETAINVAEKLEIKGLNLKIISIHTIKPIDEKTLLKEIQGQKFIFTIEEHSVAGGLSSAVAEILFKNNASNVILKFLGVPADFKNKVGTRAYLRKYFGIDEDSVYKTIIKTIKNEK